MNDYGRTAAAVFQQENPVQLVRKYYYFIIKHIKHYKAIRRLTSSISRQKATLLQSRHSLFMRQDVNPRAFFLTSLKHYTQVTYGVRKDQFQSSVKTCKKTALPCPFASGISMI